VATFQGQPGKDLKVHAADTVEDLEQVRLEKSPKPLGATLSTAISTSPWVMQVVTTAFSRIKARDFWSYHTVQALLVRAWRHCLVPFLALEPSSPPQMIQKARRCILGSQFLRGSRLLLYPLLCFAPAYEAFSVSASCISGGATSFSEAVRYINGAGDKARKVIVQGRQKYTLLWALSAV
jgi:hypothetical protein